MRALSREGKFIAICLAVAAVLIVVTALLTPSATVRDRRPTTYNTGRDGVKAAFLALPRLGYQTERWERPASDLAQVDAEQTALVVAAPQANMVLNEAAGVKDFVRRGGWVLATGLTAAEMLLPDASKITLNNDGCDSAPEGFSAIARIPHLHFTETLEWKQASADLEYARSCGNRAAVLLLPMGKGMVVFWSESAPMSNTGVKKNENLELLLASLPAPHRRVLFDEYMHDYNDYLWSRTNGTPVYALEIQAVLLAALVVFSFARRHGPLRELESVPRTSPLEFAHSMGNVYHRGGAGEAAVEQARRQLMEFLEHQCGFDRQRLHEGPKAICKTLAERFGYSHPELEQLLEPATERMAPARALKRVQALYRIRSEIGMIVNKRNSRTEKEKRG